MDEASITAFYDQQPNRFYSRLYFRACNTVYDAEARRLLDGRRYARLLELGCGTGRQTLMLAPHADELWALDLSEKSLRHAADRCAAAGFHNIRFLQQNITQLPLPDASVDGILSYGDVLSHVFDAYEQVVAEAARVLRPGGFFTFEIDGKWELDMLLHGPEEVAEARAARGRGHLRRWEGLPCKTFTHGEVLELLARAGLRLVRCCGINIFHCALPPAILMGYPEEVGALWRTLSRSLCALDRLLSRIPPFYRIASTRLITAEKP